jgi:UrcA family protein
VRRHIVNVDAKRLPALKGGVFLHQVVGDRIKVVGRITNCLLVTDPEHPHVHFLRQVLGVGLTANPAQEETLQARSVLGEQALDKGWFRARHGYRKTKWSLLLIGSPSGPKMATKIVLGSLTLVLGGRLVELGSHFLLSATRYLGTGQIRSAYRGINMKATSIGVRAIAGCFALGAAFLAGDAAAKAFDVQVAIHVSTKGIDVRQPAGAEELYRRIQHAAYVACTYGNRIDLKPVGDPVGCSEEAVGSAVRSVDAPLLTEIYLRTHTIQQASSYGIHVPKQVAAK